jgi:hypothetical protein
MVSADMLSLLTKARVQKVSRSTTGLQHSGKTVSQATVCFVAVGFGLEHEVCALMFAYLARFYSRHRISSP